MEEGSAPNKGAPHLPPHVQSLEGKWSPRGHPHNDGEPCVTDPPPPLELFYCWLNGAIPARPFNCPPTPVMGCCSRRGHR